MKEDLPIVLISGSPAALLLSPFFPLLRSPLG